VDKVVSVSCDDPAEKCTISGDDVRRAFYIRADSLDEPGMGITGIRFTSGRSPDGVISGGGGLFMYRSRVDIDNCEFSNNIARYEGTNPFTGHETAGGRGKPPPPRASEAGAKEELCDDAAAAARTKEESRRYRTARRPAAVARSLTRSL
jgi:hypothetical protein